MKLHLGVTELPYHEAGEVTETTGEVAELLERHYGVMQFFFDMHQDEIAQEMEKDLQGAMEDILHDNPHPLSFKGATSQIEAKFKHMLSAQELDGNIAGVPTKASILRKSLRFKSKKNPKNRPSFIDTGLYQKSFKSWIES